MKNFDMILSKKLQKHQHYHQVNLVNVNLTGEEILSSDQSTIIEQANFTYSYLGKVLEKTNKSN